jgi:hypothetical protein
MILNPKRFRDGQFIATGFPSSEAGNKVLDEGGIKF